MRPKYKGIRLVGGYHIPYSEAAAYKRRLDAGRKAALKAMKEICPYALSQWKGSKEDGEAVTGLNKKGELVALIHLDPEGLDLIERGLKEGRLKELLKEFNDNSGAEG